MNKENIIKIGVVVLKAAAVIGLAATAVEIIRKHWNPNSGAFKNLRSTVPALLALAYATHKGTK